MEWCQKCCQEGRKEGIESWQKVASLSKRRKEDKEWCQKCCQEGRKEGIESWQKVARFVKRS